MGFPENLKQARKANKMSQQKLADELGVDRSSIAKYETGRAAPIAANIKKMCSILNTTFDELFSD